MRIELLFFDGCPNAQRARENIRAAAARTLGHPVEWLEWDLMDPSTPADLGRYGSPTVLVNGVDVTGAPGAGRALACRADGAPTVAAIAACLTRPPRPPGTPHGSPP